VSDEVPDQLVTLQTVESPFQAQIIVAVLREAGIEAVAFDTAQAGIGIPLGTKQRGVPIQVPAEDLERARQALEQRIEDSVDLGWDEVDVGEREDRLPLTSVAHVPALVKVAVILAVLSLITMIITAWIMMNP